MGCILSRAFCGDGACSRVCDILFLNRFPLEMSDVAKGYEIGWNSG